MQEDKTFIAASDDPRKQMSLFGRMNERAKVLNDVKVNFVTVVIFIGCLAVITGVATSIAYVTHMGVRGMEHGNRN